MMLREYERCSFDFMVNNFRKIEIPEIAAREMATEIILWHRRTGVKLSSDMMEKERLSVEGFIKRSVMTLAKEKRLPPYIAEQLAEQALDQWRSQKLPKMSMIMSWALGEIRRIAETDALKDELPKEESHNE